MKYNNRNLSLSLSFLLVSSTVNLGFWGEKKKTSEGWSFKGWRILLLVLSAFGHAPSAECKVCRSSWDEKGKIHRRDNKMRKLISLNYAAPNLPLRQGDVSAFAECFMTLMMERVCRRITGLILSLASQLSSFCDFWRETLLETYLLASFHWKCKG